MERSAIGSPSPFSLALHAGYAKRHVSSRPPRRLQQHGGGGRENQDEADRICEGRPFANQQDRAADADDGRQEGAKRRGGGGKPADDGEPEQIGNPGPDGSMKRKGQNDRQAQRPKMWNA